MSRRWLAPAVGLAFVVASCGSSATKAAAPTTSADATTVATTTTAAATTAAAPATSAGGGTPPPAVCHAVGDISAAATTLDEKLDEFKITGAAAAKAGAVGFTLTNVGKGAHEFAVIKGEFASLPKNANGTVDEAQLASGALVGRVAKFAGAGGTCSGVFDLAAGTYSLLCNIEFKNGPTIISHAGKGMHVDLVVSA